MIKQGKADMVINARTSEDELYNIWSQCMVDQKESTQEIKVPIEEE
jgi:hypothetical protein